MRSVKLIDVNFNSGKGWQPGVSLSIAPKTMRWDRVAADRFPGPVVLTDYRLNTKCLSLCPIAWLVESPDIAPEIYDPRKVNYAKFKRVITFHHRLLETLPNAVEGLMGGAHVHADDVGLWHKTKLVSMIASSKDTTAGHKFRCRVTSALTDRVDLFGRGRARPLENKGDGLRDYAFSVAVENCRVPHYFSEKLIDCFLTGTVPIYWGIRYIGKWFNEDGILHFETEQEARQIVDSLTVDQYLRMLPAVTDNFHRAQAYVSPEDSFLARGYFDP